MTIEQRKLESIYLDWVNNFLTLERFAEVYGISKEDANTLIEIGRKLNEELSK
jgi:hypothetical protein